MVKGRACRSHYAVSAASTANAPFHHLPVSTNGGFSLISGAVYLRKPICAVPGPVQLEQFLNAAEVEKLGYGRHFPTLTADNVRAFLYGLHDFAAALADYTQPGNDALFAALATLLHAAGGQGG